MEPNKKEVVLIHTNDIHSQLDNVARIQTIVEQYRQQYSPDELVLVDIGDFMDRMCLETEGTDGLVHRDLLNHMQYDVVTLGNNEGLSFTHEQLGKIYASPRTFQVVCCNMSPIESQSYDWLLNSTIIQKNGIKLAFVGVTINYTSFYQLLDWDAKDPIEAVKAEIARFKEGGGVDVVVVMSHLGIRLDEQLVEACPEIDVLLGAHTHHVFNPPQQRNRTLMCAAGMSGAYLGVVHIAIGTQSKPSLTGKLISTDTYQEDEAILHIIEHHRGIAYKNLAKSVAFLDEDLWTNDFQESPLPNLLALSLSQWCGTPLSIVNSGQIIAPLFRGIVTLQDLHAICPSPINPCILKIRGIHIREAFEQSVQEEYRAKKIKGYGFRGKRLGYLAVTGFKIIVKQNKINGMNIDIYIKDELLDDDKIYDVATIDMFTFKQGYTSLAEYEEVQFFVPEYIRHLLAETITNSTLINQSKQCHWIDAT